MSVYQSASRPEKSVTSPRTTASSTMSSSSRSRSGWLAGAVIVPTLLSGRGEHLVDQVEGRVGRGDVAADHRGIGLLQRALAGDGEALPRPVDGHLVVVERGVRAGQLVRGEPPLD